MDIRKIAIFLSGKLPPYYGKSNLYSFTKALRIFAKEEYTNEEMTFIQTQAKGVDEEVYFMILDDLWKNTPEEQIEGKKSRKNIVELLKSLGVNDEILGVSVLNNTLNKDRLGKLLTDLAKINSGNDDAKKFESWSGEFLKLVFGDSMRDFYLKEQITSQDGLDIRDWIFLNNNIEDGSSISSFWNDLIKKTYDSNFIVIECKNYTDPANQNIINTTMKYLEQPGIGRLCFLFTRKGLINKGDEKVIKLLRGNSTKLPICVIVFDDEDYSELINIKIKGEKIEKYLLDKYFDLQTKL